MVEQLELISPVYDSFNPFEIVCEYSRFYIILIREMVPELKDLVI